MYLKGNESKTGCRPRSNEWGRFFFQTPMHKTMNPKIQIFDTTLRDGEQAPGYSMNLDEKVRMALQLETLGVDVMEAGFAVASPGDFASVKAIAEAVRSSSVCSLARATEKDIDASAAALVPAARPRIHALRRHAGDAEP